MSIAKWVEEYLFVQKKPFQKMLSFLLLPITFVYCIIVSAKRFLTTTEDLDIEIVSVGNLIVGGSGKTPFTVALAKKMSDKQIAVVLRGYGRKSKGLVVVARKGEIFCDVFTSGDEAMLYAVSLPKITVIVCEDRKKAILKAKELGCNLVLLDDGFSKYHIKKFDILIKPKAEFPSFCIPSGAYREPIRLYELADLVVQEDVDFTKKVTMQNESEKMVLVTAISKPKRLDEFLPKNVVAKIYFKDHSFFDEARLAELLKQYSATSILVTQKDIVKMKDFVLPISLLNLEYVLPDSTLLKIIKKSSTTRSKNTSK